MIIKNKKNIIPTEYREQEMIFEWAQLYSNKYPDLKLLNGSLNGVRLTIGQAVKCKKIGMKKGCPDINLPVVCYPYAGLYIELKRMKGSSTSKDQKWWIARLREQGYRAEIIKGHIEAIKLIKNYLGI